MSIKQLIKKIGGWVPSPSKKRHSFDQMESSFHEVRNLTTLLITLIQHIPRMGSSLPIHKLTKYSQILLSICDRLSIVCQDRLLICTTDDQAWYEYQCARDYVRMCVDQWLLVHRNIVCGALPIRRLSKRMSMSVEIQLLQKLVVSVRAMLQVTFNIALSDEADPAIHHEKVLQSLRPLSPPPKLDSIVRDSLISSLPDLFEVARIKSSDIYTELYHPKQHTSRSPKTKTRSTPTEHESESTKPSNGSEFPSSPRVAFDGGCAHESLVNFFEYLPMPPNHSEVRRCFMDLRSDC